MGMMSDRGCEDGPVKWRRAQGGDSTVALEAMGHKMEKTIEKERDRERDQTRRLHAGSPGSQLGCFRLSLDFT
jgi:hypothetical protein